MRLRTVLLLSLTLNQVRVLLCALSLRARVRMCVRVCVYVRRAKSICGFTTLVVSAPGCPRYSENVDFFLALIKLVTFFLIGI